MKMDWWTELLMVLRLDSYLVLKKEWMMGCTMEQLLGPRSGEEKVRHWVMKMDWTMELLMVLRLKSHLVLKKEWMMGCRMEQLLVPRLG